MKANMRAFHKGFTFVEALVAMSLIIIAFVNVLYLANYALGNIREARDNMVASYLAQEGIELTTAARNENWLQARAFDTGLTGSTYAVDYQGVSAATDAHLKFDAQQGFQYTTGADTAFTRRITVSKPGANIIKVQSNVLWSERGSLRSLVVEDNLYDWFSM